MTAMPTRGRVVTLALELIKHELWVIRYEDSTSSLTAYRMQPCAYAWRVARRRRRTKRQRLQCGRAGCGCAEWEHVECGHAEQWWLPGGRAECRRAEQWWLPSGRAECGRAECGIDGVSTVS